MTSAGYQLIDCGEQEKLERFGEFMLQRPCAQAVWGKGDPAAWREPDAIFRRGADGTGTWQYRRRPPDEWTLDFAGLAWRVHHNEHGNTGLFPEQEECWSWIAREVGRAGQRIEVLNLFGYTGGSTLAAARAGAAVCHVDASPSSVKQARENAERNGGAALPIRWIVEDAQRFVEREIRRGRSYQGIILDPPTYGRGARGEVWKIDEELRPFLDLCTRLLAGDARFLLLTSHSPGYTPLVLENLLAPGARGAVESAEMVILDANRRPLPSGAHARWSAAS